MTHRHYDNPRRGDELGSPSPTFAAGRARTHLALRWSPEADRAASLTARWLPG